MTWFRWLWRRWTGRAPSPSPQIHLSDIPVLNYQRHLFQERNLRSVTSNTRQDGREFLELAERIGIQVTVSRYPLDRADQALTDLAADRVNGAAVLTSA